MVVSKRAFDLLSGVLFGFVLFAFVQAVFSYQALHCEQQSSYQTPSDKDAGTVASTERAHEGDQQPAKHPLRAKPTCGWGGLGKTAVALMNDNEGFFVAIFTLVLAIVTFWLVRATLDLRGSTDRLWEAGERQMELIASNAAEQASDMKASIAAAQTSAIAATRALGADRAWLTLETVNVNEMVGGTIDNIPFNKGVAVQLVWKNRGRSPSLETVAQHKNTMIPFRSSETPVLPLDWAAAIRTVPIGPDAQFSGAALAVGDAEHAAIFAQQKALLLYGVIKYRDVFAGDVERMSEIWARIQFNGYTRNPNTGHETIRWDIAILRGNAT